jgi:dipeptidyl aminopeptidase/acylaminoacyl peptidase
VFIHIPPRRPFWLLLAAGALLSASARAQESAAKKGLTVESFFETRRVGDPQVSPDGKWIAYTLSTPDRNTDKYATALWLARVDGSENRPLVAGPANASSPRWSPDGTRIAYLSAPRAEPGGSTQIMVRWVETGDETAITNLTPPPANIAWSPDGEWLAFTRRVARKPSWEVPLPAKPANAKWGEPPVVITDLRWQQDGQGIIRPGSNQIFVVPATGGTPRQVTTGDFDYTAPKWMPDGEWILTAANRTPDYQYDLTGDEIYAFSVKDGTMRQLTHRRGPDTNPTPSPDGKRIAFTGHDFTGQSYDITCLYLMNADGTGVRCLGEKLDRDIGPIAWAPDGSAILAAVGDQGSINLQRIDLEGNVTAVTGGAQVVGPFTIARNGQIATTRSRPTEPGELFALSLKDPQWRQLTRVNEGLLSQMRLSDLEEIRTPSFDGTSIQGWIVKPPDFDPAKKYPLILCIHGGPHGMYSVAFNPEFQIFASSGYVVLYLNPRGSTGYGHKFGVAIWRHYPEDDFRDLMAGVDAVIARGYVDPKRMGITGGSGGGCLTAWGIGHTDRFAAAASLYPVSNWITEIGSADAGYFFGKIWMDGFPWENPQFYLERSPIFYAKNFKTPTLILTGEDDRRTPIAQSEELYLALKAQKVDAALVRIPQEAHGAGSNYISHRIATVLYPLKWFDRFLKPEEGSK